MPRTKKQPTKFIFVTGGVLSGLGKGITAASIGHLLTHRGFSVFMQKFDQYLNVDAGTLNPNEHGEVFVTDDGAEADLDLGHYERFTDQNLTRESSVMSGQIFATVLEKERRGDYLGKTIQFIPHVVPEVKRRVTDAAQRLRPDVMITEIGGTVGDYEGLHFIEAIRQLALDVGHDQVAYVHVGFLPYLEVTEEIKTKPLQNSINDLRRFGIAPDLVVARADHPISQSALAKIALFGGLPTAAVIPLETVQTTVYKVPLVLGKYAVDTQLMERLGLPRRRRQNGSWRHFVRTVERVERAGRVVTVGLVGKYMNMKDTYLSVSEALKAAGWHEGVKVKEKWIEAEELERAGPKGVTRLLKGIDAMVVPGGFGTRGVEGIIMAADYARRRKIPYLGLCFGLQLAVVAWARAVAKLAGAHTTEVNPKTPHPVIAILPDQDLKKLGGTMRLGAYPAELAADSQVAALYRQLRPTEIERLPGDPATIHISERHRHRYEVNPLYHDRLAIKGMRFVGLSPDGTLVEFLELDRRRHPYYVATQAHPEFRSRPDRPHPLFVGLIAAAVK